VTAPLVASAAVIWWIVGVMCVAAGAPVEQAVWWPLYLVKWLLRTLFCALFTGWRGE